MEPDHPSQGETEPLSSPGASLEEAVESFLECRRRGQKPDIQDYLARVPGREKELAELLEALSMVEEIGQEGVDGADSDRRKVTPDGVPLDRLGEYTILREIGRGGMGVVYEATQETLKRRVALKVLPYHALMDESRVQRFQFEAQAVASLSHSNIVPVFGVGKENGVYYYTMQFIDGLPLHRVLRNVRVLREAHSSDADEAGGAAAPSQFFTDVDRHAPTPDAMTRRRDRSGSRNESNRVDTGDASSTTDLADSMRLSQDGEASDRYSKNVARLGLQIADALTHAHANGVLHRDIKPSNLLLDVEGKVWVTDFGLAKVLEGEDLTLSGDIIGTLAYMAPERFHGWSDPRSDVYSLGATLYEVLTLRPAFSGSNRGELVRKIVSEEPESPRQLDARIPRDLETIVLKAIEKEPAQRYSSTQEMARDLRLFLNDIPISTRRASWIERAWRWCRRNSAAASLVLLVALLSAAGTGVLGYAFLQRNAAKAADRAMREANFLSKVNEAITVRRRGGEGRRFDSLRSLGEAVDVLNTLEIPPQELSDYREQVRTAILSAAVQSDLSIYERSRWGDLHGIATAFDQRRRRVAWSDERGQVSVRGLDDAREIARLDLEGKGRPLVLGFSAQGSLLAIGVEDRKSQVIVANLDTGEILHEQAIKRCSAFDFHPRDSRLAIGTPAGELQILAGRTGERLRSVAPLTPGRSAKGISHVAFSPGGDRVAVVWAYDRAEIHELEAGLPSRIISAPAGSGGFVRGAWNPDGQQLALVTRNFSICLWDRASGQIGQVLRGHQGNVIFADFDATGRWLLSRSHDMTQRFWDTSTGRDILKIERLDSAVFDVADPHLGLGSDGLELVRWRFAPGDEHLRIPLDPAFVWDSAFLVDERVLALATTQGVELRHAGTGKLAGRLETGETTAVLVGPKSRFLLTISPSRGIHRWPLDAEIGQGELILKVGAPERLARRAPGRAGEAPASLSRDGRWLSYPLGAAVNIMNLESGETEVLSLANGLRRTRLSPDGRWLATSTWGAHESSVMERSTGRMVLDLNRPESALNPAFSPDGKWFAAARHDSFVFYRTSDWKQVGRWARPRSSVPGRLAFLPSSNQVVVSDRLRIPTVVDISGLNDGTDPVKLATLELENESEVRWMRSGEGGRRFCSVSWDFTRVWDLSALRQRLADEGLDWNAPRPPREADFRLRVEIPSPRVERLDREARARARLRQRVELGVYRLKKLVGSTVRDADSRARRATRREGSASPGAPAAPEKT